MAKASPSSKTSKSGLVDAPGPAKPVRKSAAKAPMISTPKAELTMAGQILRDIRAGSRDLSQRADRLLRRVS
jgi:hypothetical protein